MVRSLRGELFKLRRPAVLLVVIAIVGLNALAIYLTVMQAISGAPHGVPSPPAGVVPSLGHGAPIGSSSAPEAPVLPTPSGQLLPLASASALGVVLGSGAGVISVIALIFAGWSWANEYAQGTLGQLLLRQPDRLRLLAGKSLAIFAFLLITTVVAQAVAFLVALAVTSLSGLATPAWTYGAGLRMFVLSTGNVAISCIAFAIFGTFAAILLRSPAAAVGVALAYLVPVESLISLTVKDAANWLPGQALRVVTLGSATSVPYSRALIVVVCYAVVIILVTAGVLRRRDVT